MPDDRSLRVSIIVACRNEKDDIRDLLESIILQDLGGSFEAIIADGMSDDGTRDILEEYSARYSCLRIVDNPGRIVSTGLNAAIRVAQGDLIIRMDGHTQYASDYCRTCVELMERTGADNVGGPARTRACSVLGRAVAAAFHSRFSTGGAKFHDVNHQGWVDTVPYGCWRKSVLESIGLFDEALVRNQDDELNLRLLRAGGRIWQDPSIVSWYSPRSNLSKLFHQYFQYGFWKVAVIRKHRLPASWRHLVPVVCLLLNFVFLAVMAITKAMHSQELVTDAAVLWLVMAVVYSGACVAAAICTALKREWKILPYLPAVFATYHLSYGLGFAVGLVTFRNHRAAVPSVPAVVTKLSR
ncbi:MAG: glycosyltransferase family 2 protein [Terriglobales bacterium]